jgi:beta-xylosidase
MHWGSDEWPVIGVHPSAAGTGEPVASYAKPKVLQNTPVYTPPDSDEFNSQALGVQWQWQANPQPSWAFPSSALGVLRLVNVPAPGADVNLWDVPNLLLQKFPAPAFTLTTKLTFTPRAPGDETGLVVMGRSYSALTLQNTAQGLVIKQLIRQHADQAGPGTESTAIPVQGSTFYLRAVVDHQAMVNFFYSVDGTAFHPVGTPFQAVAGEWIGAKAGLFAIGAATQGELGYADYDWIRFEP